LRAHLTTEDGGLVVQGNPGSEPWKPTGNICPIHTADADGTKLFCRVGVGGVNTNSQLVGDSFVVSSV